MSTYYEKETLYLCFDDNDISFVTDDIELAKQTESKTNKPFRALPLLSVEPYSELAIF